MFKKILSLGILTVVLSVFGFSASANTERMVRMFPELSQASSVQFAPLFRICGPTETINKRLEETYNESFVRSAEDQGLTFDLWVNEEKGTFTIVNSIETRSVTCLAAAGQLKSSDNEEAPSYEI